MLKYEYKLRFIVCDIKQWIILETGAGHCESWTTVSSQSGFIDFI